MDLSIPASALLVLGSFIVPPLAESKWNLETVAAEAPARKESRSDLPGEKVRFYEDDSLTITLDDSTRVTGEFLELTRVPLDEYEARYELWGRTSKEAERMPPVGARVEFLGGGIEAIGGGLFNGISQTGIEVRRKKHGSTETVPYYSFSNLIGPSGKRVESRWIEQGIHAGDVPSLTALRLRNSDGSRTIPLDQVMWVQSPTHPAPVSLERAVFSPVTEASRSLSIQGARYQIGDYRGYGALGRVVSATPGRPGYAVSFGFIGTGGSIVVLNVDGTTAIPLGRRLGLEPRAGAGLLAGGQSVFWTWNLGAGLAARLTPGFGVRADYTFQQLASGFGERLNSFFIGPFWVR